MKRKLFNNLLLIPLLVTICSCNNKQLGYETKGYNVKVTYDLGNGIYTENNRNTHILEIFYLPNSPITDFVGSKTYTFKNGDLQLEGFYFDKGFTERLDINTFTLKNENITLYAKWKTQTIFKFEIYYQKEGESNFTLLTDYITQADTAFNYKNSKIKYPSEDAYTFIEAYQDEAMTTLVDKNYVLTEENNSKPIYTKWVKGDYKVINTANEFTLNWGNSLYINKDLDLSNKRVPYIEADGISILGNNHTITNLKISTDGRDGKANAFVGGIFNGFNNSTIKDLTFSNIEFELDPHLCSIMYFAPLAASGKNSTIDNVNITSIYTIGDFATKNNIPVNVKNEFFYNQENCTITNSIVELLKKGE